MLRTLGYNVVRTHAFADHQPYSWVMAERLVREAESLEAIAITTDKDMVRLPLDYRGLIVPFSITLEFADDHRLQLARLISQQIGAQISEAVAGRGALPRGG
jgi:tetraacyldisaccharide 4'-kinase